MTTSSRAELAAVLRPALIRLNRVMRHQRVDQSVTVTQLSAMATLKNSGPLSAGELAAAERVQPPSMTKVLAALDERGLVVREQSPADGRRVVIRLSEAGRKLIDDERASRDLWLSERLATLDAAELELLERVAPLLDKLAEQ